MEKQKTTDEVWQELNDIKKIILAYIDATLANTDQHNIFTKLLTGDYEDLDSDSSADKSS